MIGLTLLIRAGLISGRIGGTTGNRKTSICSSDSWIDQVEGGIVFRGSYYIVTQFEAKCTNENTLPKCGYTNTGVVVNTISSANGFDSVSGDVAGESDHVGDLSFYLNGELLGNFSDSELQTNLPCPENKVITGLVVKCGAILDNLQLYCASPEGYPIEIPTPTTSKIPIRNSTKKPSNPPTLMPTNPPTQMPTNAPTPIPTNTPTQT